MKFTEQSIQKVLNEKFMPNGKYILNNLFIFHWESDYLGMSLSRYWYEVEIKISIADFKNDFKNKAEKHKILETGADSKGRLCTRPHFFCYAVPEALSEKVKPLLPSYAGLIEITDYGTMRIAKGPVLLHKRKYTDEELRLVSKFYYNYINYRDKYNSFAKELAKYRAEINNLKAEFKALTGHSHKSYLKKVR